MENVGKPGAWRLVARAMLHAAQGPELPEATENSVNLHPHSTFNPVLTQQASSTFIYLPSDFIRCASNHTPTRKLHQYREPGHSVFLQFTYWHLQGTWKQSSWGDAPRASVVQLVSVAAAPHAYRDRAHCTRGPTSLDTPFTHLRRTV